MKFGNFELDLPGLALVIAAIATAVKGIMQARKSKRRKRDAANDESD